MILFITAERTHPTKSQIITTFMNAHVPFEVVDPSTPWFKLRKKFQKGVFLCLLAPDHPHTFKICSYLASRPIYFINPPLTTLLCRSRIVINNRLSLILAEYKKSHPEVSINIPISLYYKNKIQFLSNSSKMTVPFVVKHPLNHSGIHFVELITDTHDAKQKLPMWADDVGIYIQQFVEAKQILIKSYFLGDQIIVQQDLHYLGLDQGSSIEKRIFTSKISRETIENPPVLEEFLRLIAKKLNISYFGLDFLITHDNEYWLVDFNDFPGARGIHNAGEIIANYALSLR